MKSSLKFVWKTSSSWSLNCLGIFFCWGRCCKHRYVSAKASAFADCWGELWTLLYSTYKQILPSIFQGTSFKKHNPMLLNERSVQQHSEMFFFLPTTDRKEKINQFFKNVSLHPIDCRYEDFQKYSPTGRDFRPQDLDSSDFGKETGCKRNCYKLFQRCSSSFQLKSGA